jgi:hypothetical protein
VDGEIGQGVSERVDRRLDEVVLIIRAACASAALISGPVTFGFCLTCVNARFCAWP